MPPPSVLAESMNGHADGHGSFESHQPSATLGSVLSSWALSIVTIAALGTIGWLGHATHWSFSFANHRGGHSSGAEHGHATGEPETAPSGTVQFADPEMIERSGIELVPVERRPVVSEIFCNGVVAYDERRIAQLSTRVPGSIWRVEKRLGDHVRRGDVLLVLNVSKEDAAQVAVGQPVWFRPDGSDVEHFSRISWISTEVNEATRTLQVRAEVANRSEAVAGADSPHSLRAHTFGSGRIEIDRRGTAVVVPRSSVQWDGSRWVVFVPAGEAAFFARAVEPGVRLGDVVEIASDAAADPEFTHVVGAGSHLLKSQILLERMERGEL